MSCEAGGTGTTTHCWTRTLSTLTLPLLALLLAAGATVSCYPVAATVQRHHPAVSVSSSSSPNPSTVLLHHHHHHNPARSPAAASAWDWESLLSRSILGLSSSSSSSLSSAAGGSHLGGYLLGGTKRLRRLYCNAGIGFHLEVLPDGRISGAHQENQYSLIEISAVEERGVVSLYGVQSGRFVAMSGRGRLYATTVFHDECKFKESLLPNHYNAYESWAHRGSYIALSKRGRAKRGDRATTATTATHFLPRII